LRTGSYQLNSWPVTGAQLSRLNRQLAIITAGRFLMNVGLRIVYPFLPQFALGLGVTQSQLAALISLRNFTGLSGPAFGSLSEHHGRRALMTAALALFSLGCLVVIIWPAYWFFGLAMALIALAKVIFDPALQAYLGDTVAYARRGWALTITEYSWAGAFLLGVPLAGFAIQRWGWQAPFLGLAPLGLVSLVLLRQALPPAAHQTHQAVSGRAALAFVRRQPVVWLAALYVLFVMMANEMLLIVYGAWMQTAFSLSLTNLGLATMTIGLAELSGETTTLFVVDRLGKRPVVITAGILTSLMYLLTPILSGSLAGALVALFILFLFFEITVVGGIPLLTELSTTGRGIVMSLVVAASSLGRAFGALLGPLIWDDGAFQQLGAASAGVMLVAMIILIVWIREGAAGGDLSVPTAEES
jgi:MFS transporter, DHA1 family, inner membrane transport protein